MATASKFRVLQGTRDQQPSLGDIRRLDVAPTAKFAWWMELETWVWNVRHRYSYLWPDEGKVTQVQRAMGRRIPAYRPGWPRCWYKHGGLVDNLVAAKAYHTGLLAEAEWAGGVKGWVDWAEYLEESIAGAVGKIRQQCADGHVDKGWLYNGDYIDSHRELEADLRVDLGLPPQ